MGLIRFLFFLAVLWVLWFMFRNWQRKQALDTARREQGGQAGGKRAGQKMVRCKYCEVHLPELDALRDSKSGDDVWFCTQAHKQAWLASGQNRDPS